MYPAIGVYVQPQRGTLRSKVTQDLQEVWMHYGITVAATEKHLSQTLTQLCVKCLINSHTWQMCEWHVGIDTYA